MKNTVSKDNPKPDDGSARSISAMPIHILYVAKVGQVSQTIRGGKSYFRTSFAFQDEEGRPGDRREERPLNAYALRAAFENVKDKEGVLELLSSAGDFLPSRTPLAWNEFDRWQRFVKIVRQDKMLQSVMARMMSDNERDSVLVQAHDEIEVLKALARYPTTFFQGVHPDRQQEIRNLCEWFYRPPNGAVSIEWSPLKEVPQLFDALQRGGALIEFFRDSYRMRPVFCIKAQCALQAIAATVYADRIAGVEYEKCEACGALFKIESSQSRKYCDLKCKATARKRRQRSPDSKVETEEARQTESGKSNPRGRKHHGTL